MRTELPLLRPHHPCHPQEGRGSGPAGDPLRLIVAPCDRARRSIPGHRHRLGSRCVRLSALSGWPEPAAFRRPGLLGFGFDQGLTMSVSSSSHAALSPVATCCDSLVETSTT